MASKGPSRLAKILGLIACALALTAAVIEYTSTGRIKYGLIAAGIVFGIIPFMSAGKPKGPAKP